MYNRRPPDFQNHVSAKENVMKSVTISREQVVSAIQAALQEQYDRTQDEDLVGHTARFFYNSFRSLIGNPKAMDFILATAPVEIKEGIETAPTELRDKMEKIAASVV